MAGEMGEGHSGVLVQIKTLASGKQKQSKKVDFIVFLSRKGSKYSITLKKLV